MTGSAPGAADRAAAATSTGTAIRLVAIDIDGTLLDGRGNLPDRNRDAVHRAARAGIHVALATGRAFHHASPIARALWDETLPADGLTILVSNGALVKQLDGATIASRLLPREIARGIIAAMRPRHRGVAVIFDRSDARQYVCDGIDWSHPRRHWYYQRNRAWITKAEPIEEALTEDPVQVAYTGSVAQMRALADAVRTLPEADRVTITLTEYAAHDFSLLDIITAGASKGAALAAVAGRLRIGPANVMAVGDNLNDREMLMFAGAPVVMGNAVAPLLALGWPVTGTHDDCGLAQALDTLPGA
ncbi:MAG: HAD-IIB family hydrolase [Acidobacteria bacterium]|nr:HAD-IIB family hydrolase [Acidobacteriota bacterium]MYJ05578.1 HAD-IIB family hydrolase [Acidobacteriota bacterium]